MAESIALYFRAAGWDELGPELSRIAQPGKPFEWFYPPPPEENSVALYSYDDPECHLLDELEPDARERLLEALGGLPSAILAIELRRSWGRRAVDDAAFLALHLLRRFDGIADDVHGGVWTLEEMESGAGGRGAFLEAYRSTLTG